MLIRDFQEGDREAVEAIFALYWTDQEFLKELFDKLNMCVAQTEEYIDKSYKFFVADEHGEVVGVAAFRDAPEHMAQYANGDKPVEFYVLAAKYKGRGIGEALRLRRLEEARKMGFTEAVLYSPDSHKESWGFHDRLGFKRVGPAIAPDGEPGMIWRKEL